MDMLADWLGNCLHLIIHLTAPAFPMFFQGGCPCCEELLACECESLTGPFTQTIVDVTNCSCADNTGDDEPTTVTCVESPASPPHTFIRMDDGVNALNGSNGDYGCKASDGINFRATFALNCDGNDEMSCDGSVTPSARVYDHPNTTSTPHSSATVNSCTLDPLYIEVDYGFSGVTTVLECGGNASYTIQAAMTA